MNIIKTIRLTIKKQYKLQVVKISINIREGNSNHEKFYNKYLMTGRDIVCL